MNINWKYVEDVDTQCLTSIEKHFNVSLPADLQECIEDMQSR
jgi:hypothetical protein